MKRNILRISYVVIVLGLAVCCAAAVRPDLFGLTNNDKVTTSDGAESVDTLSDFVLEREQLRSMQLGQLDDIINAPASSEELVAEAQEQKLGIVKRMEIEQTVSGVLKARGYEDAAVAASEASVSVMIRKDEITEADTAVVLELVLSETDVAASDVRIIPVN
jgi:stage III sporulation protein AH